MGKRDFFPITRKFTYQLHAIHSSLVVLIFFQTIQLSLNRKTKRFHSVFNSRIVAAFVYTPHPFLISVRIPLNQVSVSTPPRTMITCALKFNIQIDRFDQNMRLGFWKITIRILIALFNQWLIRVYRAEPWANHGPQ